MTIFTYNNIIIVIICEMEELARYLIALVSIYGVLFIIVVVATLRHFFYDTSVFVVSSRKVFHLLMIIFTFGMLLYAC